MRRWLHRNRWALVALPVLAALVFVVAGGELRAQWRRTDAPGRRASVGEPFDWSDGTFTLQAVERVADPIDADGAPFAPPPGTVVWRTRWSGRGTADGVGAGCVVQLVDAQGRWFSADPADLSALDLDHSCSPGLHDDVSGYDFDRTFLLPADAKPAAVRFGGFGGLGGAVVEIAIEVTPG